ncbi:LLM class flavin-dependent oxidoreductase [Gulosibacter chungangensis]|uniref:LLM class flavin-dependent oxidoreductase n=1 Tax=Gulosibacter chungangensis TaxID=979746 RepID=A0A7J5BDG2_9MICO|nr:LLM class flavin-dependent oxidoreductase [Gulosibacter chungangensis]KAB1644221.1 LLM class flavin-dependent oxidoreductase [Gulosibacter chungangensis]
MAVPLSILDLVPISEGSTPRAAIDASVSAARLADKLGYERLWFAEHHNTEGVASNATALLISEAAAATERIRVGSGGVMLPNHSPLMVAEQYGTLASRFGDRIDLGLGRAPGTDPMTARALARSSGEPLEFARNIFDLHGWFGEDGVARSAPILSPVSAGTNVPMWVLGSSVNGASIAGQLGLPFALASHFLSEGIGQIIDEYRRSFATEAPTARLQAPYLMAGINVLVAPTDEEAEFQYTTAMRRVMDNSRGERRRLQPPVTPATLKAEDGADLAYARVRAVGSPETVKAELETFVAATGADELIIATYAFEPSVRERSLQLLADLWF